MASATASAMRETRYQVPDGLLADDAERVDHARGDVAVCALVEEAEFDVACDYILNDGQHGKVFGFGRWAPSAGIDVQAGADGIGLAPHAARQGGHQLAERALGRGDEAGIAEGAGLGHQEAAQLCLVEAWDLGAPTFGQLPSAVHAAHGEDRNS
jgi:hypothetical protein